MESLYFVLLLFLGTSSINGKALTEVSENFGVEERAAVYGGTCPVKGTVINLPTLYDHTYFYEFSQVGNTSCHVTVESPVETFQRFYCDLQLKHDAIFTLTIQDITVFELGCTYEKCRARRVKLILPTNRATATFNSGPSNGSYIRCVSQAVQGFVA